MRGGFFAGDWPPVLSSKLLGGCVPACIVDEFCSFPTENESKYSDTWDDWGKSRNTQKSTFETQDAECMFDARNQVPTWRELESELMFLKQLPVSCF